MNRTLLLLAALVAVVICQPFSFQIPPTDNCAKPGRNISGVSRELTQTTPRSSFCAVLTQACGNTAYFDLYKQQFGRFPAILAEANTLLAASGTSATATSTWNTYPQYSLSTSSAYKTFVNNVMKQFVNFHKMTGLTGFQHCAEFQHFVTQGLSASSFCSKIQTGTGQVTSYGRWDNKTAAWAKWYDEVADAGEHIGTHIFDESLHELNKRGSESSKKKCFFEESLPQDEGVFGAGFVIKLQRVALTCKKFISDDEVIVPVAASLTESRCLWSEVNRNIGQNDFGECMCQIFQNGNDIDVCTPPPELNIQDLKKNLNFKACLFRCPGSWADLFPANSPEK